jgi:hypothetical protein
MGMNNIWFSDANNLTKPAGRKTHLSQQARAFATRGTVKSHPIDIFLEGRGWTLFGRCEVEGFPPELALLTQDGQGAKGIATV